LSASPRYTTTPFDPGAEIAIVAPAVASKWKEKQKELQQPDEFVSFWAKTGEVMAKRARVLITAMVMILTVVAGIQFANYLRDNKSAERAKVTGRLLTLASAPLLPAEGEAPKYDDDVPHFKTDKERKEAAIKEADQLISRYEGKAVAHAARMLKARFLIDLGRHADAAALLEKLQNEKNLEPEMQMLAQESLAFAKEAQGQTGDALAAFEALAKRGEATRGFLQDRAMVQQARLLEKSGELEKARALLKTVNEKFPNSNLSEDVSERLALLEEATAPAPAAAPAATAAPAAPAEPAVPATGAKTE
jgi:hypothetical protein